MNFLLIFEVLVDQDIINCSKLEVTPMRIDICYALLSTLMNNEQFMACQSRGRNSDHSTTWEEWSLRVIAEGKR